MKIIAGAGDNAAAAVGTGTVGDGMCNISLGTSGTIFISSKTFGVDSNNALHSFDHADGYYHLMGCMLSAASCNKWWMDEILKTKEYSKEQEGITKCLAGNEDRSGCSKGNVTHSISDCSSSYGCCRIISGSCDDLDFFG